MNKQEMLLAIEKMPDDLFVDNDVAIDLFSSALVNNSSIIDKLKKSMEYTSEDCIDLDTLDAEIRSILGE